MVAQHSAELLSTSTGQNISCRHVDRAGAPQQEGDVLCPSRRIPGHTGSPPPPTTTTYLR